jgi:hypothetical protein
VFDTGSNQAEMTILFLPLTNEGTWRAPEIAFVLNQQKPVRFEELAPSGK